MLVLGEAPESDDEDIQQEVKLHFNSYCYNWNNTST